MSLAQRLRAEGRQEGRQEGIALGAARTKVQMLERMMHSGRSRYPVCRGGLDEVIGVVSAPKLLQQAMEGRELSLAESSEDVRGELHGEEGLGEGAIRRAGGYGDKIGVRGTLEPVGGDDCEAARCRHRSTRVEGTDPEVERRHTVVGAVDAEDLSEDPELEGRGARCEQGSDDLNHRTRMAENKRTTPDLPLVA